MFARPRLRIPVWSALAIVGAAYLIRSFVRDSLRPDIPADLIVLGMLAVVVLVVAYVRSNFGADDDGSPERDAAPADSEAPAKATSDSTRD